MEENFNNQQPKMQEQNIKTKKKKAKVAVIILSTIIVLFLGLQIYASTNGYGNVFFMIKDWTTSKSASEDDEVFKEGKLEKIKEEDNTSKTTNTNNNNNTDLDFFEKNANLQYDKDLTNPENGKVAIIKSGEEILKTNQNNGYYTYTDMWNNSYNIKKIKDVKSKFIQLGKDKQSALYKCTIYYIDNNNQNKSFDVAVIVAKDAEGGIAGTYDNYTGSTSYTRWSGLYDEGNTQNNQLEPDNYAEEVMKDDVKILFFNKLKKDNENNIEKLLDYRVEEVMILSDKEKKGIVENDYTEYFKNTDTLAEVTYSVKPKDINNTGWISGNGEISGEWIKNKIAYICVRNGEIVFSGTGW